MKKSLVLFYALSAAFGALVVGLNMGGISGAIDLISTEFSLSALSKGFVTGAARGIGKCTATGFAEAGADVAIVDLDYEEAVKTAGEIAAATGRKVIAVKCDCTDKEQVEAMVRTVVEELGGLDFCHNNAGICINAPAEEMTYEQWMKVININLNGVFLTDIEAGKYMLEHGGGSIINTASMSGHIVNVPQPQCAYNASIAAD